MAANVPAPTLKVPVSDRDHVIGPTDAPLVLVEYGDYECPHCGKAAAVVEQLIEQFGPRLRFAYRHFPMAKMHPHARLASEAAEAAAREGKFWDMHRLLFAHQKELEPVHLLAYATELNLDLNRFRQDLEAHAYAPRLQDDIAGGVRSGVNGTPTFFVQGERHNGYDPDSLARALEAAGPNGT